MFYFLSFPFLGIFCAPLLLVAACRQQWNMGYELCYAFSAVISTSLNVSIMTLFLISLDRLYAVSKPFHYRAQETFTQKWTYWLIGLAWLHSVFWATAPVVGWGEIIKEEITHTCKPNWSAVGLKNRLYSMGLAGFTFAFPVLSMIFIYVIIYYRSKVSGRFMRSLAESSSLEEKARQKQQNAILRTVLVIVGAFVLCWLPYTVSTTFRLFLKSVPPAWLVHLGLMLASSNSFVNPAIYSAFDKGMRDEFKSLCRFWAAKRGYAEDGVRSRRSSSNLARINTVAKISNETLNRIIRQGNASRTTTPSGSTDNIDTFAKNIEFTMDIGAKETWV